VSQRIARPYREQDHRNDKERHQSNNTDSSNRRGLFAKPKPTRNTTDNQRGNQSAAPQSNGHEDRRQSSLNA